jgi:beta-N-acetylhexosaminidase
MSAHILFPALDPERPATLSRRILTGLLREEMGFAGLIFTDAMDMKAIATGYGLVESTILAKLAGVDVLEANEPIADQIVRHGALVEALESGRIPREAFEATVDRLSDVRDRYRITGVPAPLPERSEERWSAAFDIALGTIAWRGHRRFRPIEGEGTVFVDFQRFRATEAEDPVGRAGLLRNEVIANLPQATVVTLSDVPTEEEIEMAVAAAGGARTLVILTRDASDLPRQVSIANRAIAAVPEGGRVIHCPMRGPYDAGALDRVDDLLFTFGDPAISIRALVATLVGIGYPPARLPVTVPGIA